MRRLALLALIAGLAGVTFAAAPKVKPSDVDVAPSWVYNLGGVQLGPSGKVVGTFYGDGSHLRNVPSAQGGTVSSVTGSTAIPGLSITGGPITTTGTLTLGLTSASSLRTALGLAIGTDIPSFGSNTYTGPQSVGSVLSNLASLAADSLTLDSASGNSAVLGQGSLSFTRSGTVTAGPNSDGTAWLFNAPLDVTGSVTASGGFKGNADTATHVAASGLTGSHTLPDGVLSANVPLLSAPNTWAQGQTVGSLAGNNTNLSATGLSINTSGADGASLTKTALSMTRGGTVTLGPNSDGTKWISSVPIDTTSLGTGTPSTATFLRGDGSWTAMTAAGVANVPRVVSVTDYGATGNGTTDDYNAIHSAIAALPASGGTLYFPPGTYRIARYVGDSNGTTANDLLLSGKSNLSISGYGAKILMQPEGTVTRSAGTSETTAPLRPLTLFQCTNVTIEGLELDGSGSSWRKAATDQGESANGYGISTWECRNVTVRNVYAHGFLTDGLYIGGSATVADRNIVLENVRSEGNARNGCSVVQAKGVQRIGGSYSNNGTVTGYGGHLEGVGWAVEPDAYAPSVDVDTGDIQITGGTEEGNAGTRLGQSYQTAKATETQGPRQGAFHGSKTFTIEFPGSASAQQVDILLPSGASYGGTVRATVSGIYTSDDQMGGFTKEFGLTLLANGSAALNTSQTLSTLGNCPNAYNLAVVWTGTRWAFRLTSRLATTGINEVTVVLEGTTAQASSLGYLMGATAGAIAAGTAGSAEVISTVPTATLATTATTANNLPATLSGLVKAWKGAVSAAVSGTDYAPPSSGTALQKGDGAGGFAQAAAGTDYLSPSSNLDAGKLASGTVADARLSANVPILSSGALTLNPTTGAPLTVQVGGATKLQVTATGRLSGTFGPASANVLLSGGNETMTGNYNTAMGVYTLNANTTGNNNTAMGMYTLYANTTGNNNTAAGVYTLNANTTGGYNTAVGYAALNANTTGGYNTAMGMYTLYANTTGGYNTAMGMYTLNANMTGNNNTAAGYAADVLAPAAPSVAAVAGTGMSVGAYRYVVVWTHSDGTKYIGAKSGSVTTTAPNANVSVTSIPVYAGPLNITGKALYRTVLSGYPAGNLAAYYKVADLALSDTTYTDAIPDATAIAAGILGAGISNSIALGYNTRLTASGQFVAGSTDAPIADVYFGSGVYPSTAGAGTGVTIHGTGGNGTDRAGGSVTIAGGIGTGTGAGGSIVFQTAPAGVSAATANALATVLTLDSKGQVTIPIANVRNAANDAAAAALTPAVPVGGIYRNGSVLMIRAS